MWGCDIDWRAILLYLPDTGMSDPLLGVPPRHVNQPPRLTQWVWKGVLALGRWCSASGELRTGISHSACGCTCEWQVKLCDTSLTSATPEHFTEKYHTRCKALCDYPVYLLVQWPLLCWCRSEGVMSRHYSVVVRGIHVHICAGVDPSTNAGTAAAAAAISPRPGNVRPRGSSRSFHTVGRRGWRWWWRTSRRHSTRLHLCCLHGNSNSGGFCIEPHMRRPRAHRRAKLVEFGQMLILIMGYIRFTVDWLGPVYFCRSALVQR